MGQTNELELEGEHHQHVATLLAACLDPPLCSCTGHILQLRSQLTCAPFDSASRPALLPFRRAARRVHGAVLRRRLAVRAGRCTPADSRTGCALTGFLLSFAQVPNGPPDGLRSWADALAAAAYC
jgi:hypothetical protein